MKLEVISLGYTKTSDVKYLLDQNYHPTKVYHKLSETFGGESREMMHFAKPQISGNSNVAWVLEISSEKAVKKIKDLTDEEKGSLIADLAENRSAIENKLKKSNDVELKKIANHVFSVPDEDSIKAVWINGEWKAVLTQWCCVAHNSEKGRDTVDILIKKYPSEMDNVSLSFIDTGRNPVPDFAFYRKYKNSELKETTDKNGNYSVGLCRIDLSFTISADINGKKRELKTFKVEKDGVYNVLVPFYQDIRIKALNQKGEAVVNESFSIHYKGAEDKFLTDQEGIFILSDYERGEEVEVIDDHNSASILKFNVEKDKDYYEIIVDRSKLLTAKIKVVNESNVPMGDYSLKIERQNQSAELRTDSEGLITLNDCKDKELIKVSNLKNESNYISCEIIETSLNEFTLIITEDPVKKVKVRFVDRKNQPLKNSSVTFKFNNRTVISTTDNEGCCYFNHNEFIDKEKVKVNIKKKS